MTIQKSAQSQTYYCPRGCNVCDERAAYVMGFECGACGATMTTDDTRYKAALEAIEERQIEAIEREIAKEEAIQQQIAEVGAVPSRTFTLTDD